MFIAQLTSYLLSGQDLHEIKAAIMNKGGAHEAPPLRKELLLVNNC